MNFPSPLLFSHIFYMPNIVEIFSMILEKKIKMLSFRKFGDDSRPLDISFPKNIRQRIIKLIVFHFYFTATEGI